MSGERKNIDWKDFVDGFEMVNTFYRGGLLEIVITEKASRKYRDLETDPRKEDNSLLNVADRLYQTAFNAWTEKNIPKEYFAQVLGMLVCSFEIDNYFFCVNADKYLFFQEFVDDFLQSSESLETNFQGQIDKVCQRISPTPQINDENFFLIANGILLLCLCGIDVYYIAADSTDPEEGLKQVRKLIKYIDYLSARKTKAFERETLSHQDRGLGLKGLAHYFLGRFLFTLGKFNESEQAFDKSKSYYLEKMFWKVNSTESTDAESRVLSLRRANLAQILGKVRICLRQSRLSEALEILEKIRPLLSFATGKVMSRIADLMYVSTKRAKFSSDSNILRECKQLAEKCYVDFKRYTPNSYFVHRCNIEISLINFSLTQLSESETEKQDLVKKSLEKLNETVKYAELSTDTRAHKNLRLLVEALINRSFIRMTLPISNLDFTADARRACKLAKGMKQLECDALIALGLVWKKALDFSLSGTTHRNFFPKMKKKDLLEYKQKAAVEYKQKAAECFFEAKNLNNDENPRVTVISNLRLAELETLFQPNYLLAKFHFERYEKYKGEVEHKYVLELAKKLEKKLLERRVPEFYLDTSKSLIYKEWADDLKRCLITHAIYQKAIEIGGIMPAKRRRGENAVSKNSSSTNKNPRQTRQSMLAEIFKNEIKLSQTEAFSLAKKHLKEFENICNSIRASK